MEAGYSTVDLVMLAIAAFIIWAVMRTPTNKKLADQRSIASAEQ